MKERSFSCPVDAAISVFGGKYKAVILWHLMTAGTLRYSEIKRRVPQATDKMLAQQLRELEADGLVSRKVYPVVPPKTEYRLTKSGATLAPILDAACEWGKKWLSAHGIAVPEETSCAIGAEALFQFPWLP